MTAPVSFGKYTLLKKINTGGMAEIYLAIQSGVEGFEKLIAIKRILPHLTDNQEFVSMFIDEAKLAAQLTHPNIIHIYDFGKIEDSFYIAMEYLAGKNLREIVKECKDKNTPVSIKHAGLIIRAACKALDYAHRKRDLNNQLLNIVHRDVSPQNILVSYEGEVKLVDFGIAKAALHSQETKVGVLKGKLAYMSPEQATGKPLDRRSDLFAVGIVFYELLTATRLFTGDSEFSVLEKVRKAQILPPSKLNKNVPSELEKVVLKALALKPEDRYQTGAEMQQAIDRVLQLGEDTDASATLAGFINQLFSFQIASESQEMKRLLEEYKGKTAEKTVAVTVARFEHAPKSADSSVYTKWPKKWKAALAACGILFLAVIIFTLNREKPASTDTTQTVTQKETPAKEAQTAENVSALNMTLSGSLKILANISGAEIYIDGEKIPQLTDREQEIYIADITAEETHHVRLRKEGYDDWQTDFKLAAGQDHLIRPEMGVRYARLQISSQPDHAQVYLNDKPLEDKYTPASIDQLLPGKTYTVKLYKSGYSTWQQKITLKTGEEKVLSGIQLQPAYAQITVDSDPPGAQVYLDGSAVSGAFTPVALDKLIPGKSYTLGLRRAGFALWEKDIVPRENDNLSLGKIHLARQYGRVQINSQPAGAQIYLNGELQEGKTTPALLENLAPGREYTISLQKEGFASWRKAIAVQEEQTLKLKDAVLEQLFGTLTINTIPWSEIYWEENKLGVTPLAGIKMPAGSHELKFVNATVGIEEKQMIKINADQINNQIIKFEGDLTVNALPWAEVYINGEKKGTTPLAGIKLLAGVHQIRLVNPSLNYDRTSKVIIKPNRTTTKIANLKEE